MDDFISAFSDSWRFFKRHLLAICSLLLPFAVPLDIMSAAVSQLAQQDESYRYAPIVVGIIEALLYPIIQGALILYIAETIKGESHSNSSYYRRALQFWHPLFLLYVITSMAMITGFMLFIIPGFIILSRLAFAEFYCLFDHLSPTEALSASWQNTQDQQWLLFKGIITIFLIVMLPLWGGEYLLTRLELWHPSIGAIGAIVTSILSALFTIFAFRVFSETSSTSQASNTEK